VLSVGGVLFGLVRASAGAQTPQTTAGEFWPAVDVHDQLLSNVRLLGFGELKKGENSPYQQADIGAGIGYQWGRFTNPHLKSIDPDKENFLVTGAGYEYLRTIQSGKDTQEDRLVVQATPRYRPPAEFLLTDRNRVEFRWVDGNYSTRYRNRLTAERAFSVRGFRIDPYVSAEFFYDIPRGSWSQEQYAAGVQLPHRRLLMVDLYYLRQNCDTCNPEHLNVFGLTVNVYFGKGN